MIILLMLEQLVSLEERMKDIEERYQDDTGFLKVAKLAWPRFRSLEKKLLALM